jgi:putative serine protease PepD
LRNHRKKQKWNDKRFARKNSLNSLKADPMQGASHSKGIVVERIGIEAKQPNSAIRKSVRVQLIKNGKATYPVIGVSIDMKFEGEGALITKNDKAILPGGPAAKAGLKAGDVITKFDGRTITTAEELIVAIRAKNVGDKVELTYTRNGVSATATVVLNAGK